MRKFTIWLTCLFFLLSIGVVSAQTSVISGKVTSADEPNGIPGVTVIFKGTANGITTNIDGDYSLEVPAGATILKVSYVGFKTKEIEIGSQSIINILLEADVFALDEVIVSGVASGTQRKKLTVSVGKVGSDALEKVPAASAASALQGKMAGVHVTSNSGAPGSAATILVRGATSLMGSQEPLYIIDGAIIEGGLGDINVNDIESFEVVKGASAAALYGSRAGNGVIVITTKRGSNLAEGETKITFRNEFGVNKVGRTLDLAEHHPYTLNDPSNPGSLYTEFGGVTYPEGYTGGSNNNITGSLTMAQDHYADNPFAFVNDLQGEMFKDGMYYNNYISVANRSRNTNFLVSFENNQQEGIIQSVDGYNRKNFRINVDHQITKNLKFTASNLIGKSITHAPGGVTLSNGGAFFDVLFLFPDVDLQRANEENGAPYDLDVSNWNANEDNPLYALSNQLREDNRTYMIGTYGLNWYATDWLTLDAKYAFDRRNRDYTQYQPKGFLTRGGSGLVEDQGFIYKVNDYLFSESAQFTANFNKQFGKFTTKAKLSYLYEDMHSEENRTTGYDFSVSGIPSLNSIVGTKVIEDEIINIRSDNFFGIFQTDYEGKYLADVMFRYDGSSLFGENQRWHPYYRLSGAWRVSEDFKIPGIQEFKVRAAYGTSGQRPGFYAQYETFKFENGLPVPNTLGNKELKPSTSKELETGFNVEFLDRFNFEFIYSETNTEDQIMPAPLAAYYGYKYQWLNAGSLNSKVFEASLDASIMKSKDFSWNATLIFDRIRQTVTKLDIPAFQVGPIGQDADQAFYIREGETFGVIYGSTFLTGLDQLSSEYLSYSGTTVADYEMNSDGYIIPKGTQGTVYEKPVKLLDGEGNPVKGVIGNTNPKFNLGLSSTMNYKNFTFYFLLDWKNGGDIYNRTQQWLYRDLRHADVDQFAKADYEKKVTDYYSSLYDVNDINSHFVEDASFLKLREASIYFTLDRDKLKNFAKGYFKSIRFGLIGRNLLTFTNYSGYDPEVGQINDGDTDTFFGSNQFFSFDAYGYPNTRTISGSITVVF